jgi:DNA-cytosine methyltransferase
MTLKILDLFSGLGGFSLGLERTGHFKTIAFCDNNKYCNLVLQKHWKGVKIYNDVKEITKERLKTDGVEAPDIITGGFPCQSFSIAGKRKGTDDPRYLWPEMFRIIQEFTPRWVIGENVKGLTNIQDGMVFETVCTDLEGEGYEVRAFNIPAAGVGAPHRRERIWIVAHAKRYNKTDEIRRSYEEERRIQEEHRQDNSSSRLTSGTSSIWQSNNGHEDVAHSNDTRNRTPKHEINEDGQKIDEGWQEQSQLKSSGHSENVENSRRTLQQGTELREKNEDEVGEGYANQHQRSSSTSESNVANAKGSGTRENDEGLWSRTSGVSGRQETSGTKTDVANAISRDVEAGRERQRGIRKESQGQGTSSDVTGSGETKRTEKKLADTNSERLEGQRQSSRQFSQTFFATDSSEERQRQVDQGWWSVEPNVGRVAHGVSGRVHRLKGLGNSIVPQIVEEIGYAIIKATERK